MKTFQEFLDERGSEYDANNEMARASKPVTPKNNRTPEQKEKDAAAAKAQLSKIDLTPTKKTTQ